ncbi:hypothetical protein T440DRAFT_278798 [Plenodomus tracheiphilus IPT5]|uniref:Uncharacterized protein n=1 Tax=Plenodomus tracheiphilus IPT5 TaxID=1408161 RepID=A0A6A7ASI8_9PLEO|nr:hypothetical protein T440DRAFT_278798 [Plenodomus tracheiphilus IPT5]
MTFRFSKSLGLMRLKCMSGDNPVLVLVLIPVAVPKLRHQRQPRCLNPPPPSQRILNPKSPKAEPTLAFAYRTCCSLCIQPPPFAKARYRVGRVKKVTGYI